MNSSGGLFVSVTLVNQFEEGKIFRIRKSNLGDAGENTREEKEDRKGDDGRGGGAAKGDRKAPD